MRILLLSNHLVVINFKKELITKLAQLGHEVFVSFPYKKEDDISSIENLKCKLINTKINRHGLNPVEDIVLFNEYKKIIKNVNPDYIISLTIKCNIYGSLAASKYNVPILCDITGLGKTFYKKSILKNLIVALYKYSFKNIKKCFFENVENQQIMLDLNIVPKEKAILVFGAGVNLEEYNFSTYPKNNNFINFLYTGRIMKEKGVDELFYAIEKISSKYNNVMFHFVGFFEEKYENRIKDLEQRNLIKYYGFQNNVKPFIEECNCLILPSYHEGMSNSLLEAASMGRPLITSNIHGCKETVIDGESGLLVESENAEDLCEKIIQFIELPYDKKIKMGKEARSLMEKNFNRDLVVDSFVNEIKNK